MDEKTKTKQLMKILVGAAWIDGIIQPEEREYLRRMAKDQELMGDSDIQALLSEIKPVTAKECYQWLEEYLGESNTHSDYEQLLERISALIYSDSDVDIQEAKLLNRLQKLDPANEPKHSLFDQLLKSIQKLYRQAINNQK
jgi:uncharacterized tellurite resistance protein B-like protein